MVDRARVFAIARQSARQEIDIHSRIDPVIARHADELFGTGQDLAFAPAETRYVQPGHVLVEWIGDVSPGASEQILAACRLGLLPPKLVKAIYRLPKITSTRIDTVTDRAAGVRDGLQRTYRWGPARGTYVQEMPIGDATKLLDMPCGREFRIVGRGAPADQPTRDPIELYIPPSLRAKVRAVVVAVGDDQVLTGVAAGGRQGQWT